MNTLSFETGIKTFDINGDPERVLSFNPTDLNFIHRLYDAYGKLNSIQGVYQVKTSKMDDTDKLLKTMHQADLEIRKVIDTIFDEPVADMIFGKQSTFAVAGDGSPLWAGFIIAVMANCDESMTERENAKNPKLEALIMKYKK